MDLPMEPINRIEATREIRARYDDVEVVALTSFVDEDRVYAALAAGTRIRIDRVPSTRSTANARAARPLNRPICMMNGAARGRTLARMSKAGEVMDRRDERITEWRDAGDRVLSAYKAWCAATRSDRHELYVDFLHALRREERAAWQVGHARSGQGAADAGKERVGSSASTARSSGSSTSPGARAKSSS